ncbi:MAG: PspC domain-containing protein [Bacteroidota bacterium]
MEIETVHHYDYDDFLESNLELSDQNVKLIGEADPKVLSRDTRAFSWAGMAALASGIAIFIATNFGFMGMKDFLPFIVATGIVALGVGLMKGFRRILGRRRLNLPRLQVRRKTKKRVQPSVTREIPQVQQVVTPPRRRSRKWSLTKSSTDSVIMGVCGGLAESSGINSALVRLLFIAAFAMTGGSAAVVYFLLGAFLPADETPKIKKRRNKRDIPVR